MKKIEYFEQLKARLDWMGTCSFDSDEELEDYYRELDAVNKILIELKGGAR